MADASDGMLASRRRRHGEMLVISLLVIAASLLLRVGGQDDVTVLGSPSLTLPPLCMSRELFGVSCPGCGLTRSFVELAHGQWERAATFHRVGWLLAAAVVLQIPYRIAGLRHPTGQPLGEIVPRLVGYALIAALVGNWLWRVLMG